ncbi:unnamed protein product [Laminaria digitata]
MMCNGPVRFKVDMQGLTAQSTIEAELVAVTLGMKAVYCAGMMKSAAALGSVLCVPTHIGNTSAFHVTGNKTYSPRVKHVALRFFYVREIIQECKISIHHVPTELNMTDMGTKFLSKHRHPYLIGLGNNFQT